MNHHKKLKINPAESSSQRLAFPQFTLKLLFIEDGLEEKSAATHLEELTARLIGIPCVFTVIPSCFLALETCEHTDFDGIFICGHSLKLMNAFDFLRIFRSVGGLAPVLILSEYYDDIEIEDFCDIDGNMKTCYEYTNPLRFNGKLHKPFTKKEICSSIVNIYQALQARAQSLALKPLLKASSSTTSPKKRLMRRMDTLSVEDSEQDEQAQAQPQLKRVQSSRTQADTPAHSSFRHVVTDLSAATAKNQQQINLPEQRPNQIKRVSYMLPFSSQDQGESSSFQGMNAPHPTPNYLGTTSSNTEVDVFNTTVQDFISSFDSEESKESRSVTFSQARKRKNPPSNEEQN